MAESTTYIRSIASMSWISPSTGLREVDDAGDPGDHPWRRTIVGEKVYRFANFLEAFITVSESGEVVGHGFTQASGMYRNLSYLKMPSYPFDVNRDPKIGTEPVRFRQLVGCKTRTPETIGIIAGAAVGGRIGVGVGAVAGAPFAGVGSGPGAVIGGVGGAAIGGYAGYKAARAIQSFPPIWTELELCIYRDGRFSGRVLKHSLFPSHNFYIQDFDFNKPMNPDVHSVFSRFDGVPNYKEWYDNGWGPLQEGVGPCRGNPFNETK